MDETEFSLLHKPGEKWTYGASTKILGDLISKVEGEDLEQSLKRLVLDPLGMNKTSFKPRENQAVPHRLEDGNWVSTEKFPRIDAGDGGLISTVKDYEKFLRCFLNKGDPILSAEMVKEMTTNQIGDLWIETQPERKRERASARKFYLVWINEYIFLGRSSRKYCVRIIYANTSSLRPHLY